jgi:hypothetical protein
MYTMAPIFHKIDGLEHAIDPETWEKDEQKLARENVKPGACVLELGGRYGVVSWAIQEKLADKTKHVVVEVDDIVIPALKANRDNNNCQYHIVNGFVGNREAYVFHLNVATFILFDDEIEIKNPEAVRRNFTNFSRAKKHTWDELEELCGHKFDTVIADIEGSFVEFIKEHEHKLDQLKTIVYERDGSPYVDYALADSILTQHGFVMSNCLNDQRVYTKAW